MIEQEGGAPLRYRILGPVEARGRGGWRRIPAARQRLLLALLIINHDRVVSTERLLDEIWDGRPPASGAKVVHNYVARLRRLLDDTDAWLVTTRPPGYALAVTAGEVDAVAAERALATGRRLSAAGRHGEAREVLRRALRLWRGEPLMDVPAVPTVTHHAARLEALRLDLLESSADVDLTTGRHAGLADTLGAALAAHPLRESLWACYIRALRAAGRRADALAAYQRAYRTLRDQLGVEPGEELRRLHRDLLDAPVRGRDAPVRGREALVRGREAPVRPTTAGPAPVAAGWRLVPRQLPPSPGTFTGRADELAALLTCLGRAGAATADVPAPRVACLHGPGGVGKTALAVHAAHRLASRARDGQLYLDLRGATPGLRAVGTGEAVARLLRALGVPGGEIPVNATEAVTLYRSVTADLRLLIVLDNAVDAAQVTPLLPASSRCLVLVTSRAPVAIEGAHQLRLGTLSPQDSRTLLTSLVGTRRCDADPPALDALADMCGHLPLALRIAGGRLATRPAWSIRRLAERMSSRARLLDELRLDDVSVRGSILTSYDLLGTDAAQRAFRLIGEVGLTSLAAPAVAALTGEPPAGVEAALEQLVHAQLVDELPGRRYGVHDLNRLVGAELAADVDPARQRSSALLRLVEHYAAPAARARDLLRPASGPPKPAGCGGVRLDDRDDALAWFEREHPNLVVLVGRVTPADGLDAVAATARLSQAVGVFLHLRMYLDELDLVTTRSVELAAHVGDAAMQAVAADRRAIACYLTGRLPEAREHQRAGLRLYRETGNLPGEARAWGNLGVIEHGAGRARTALRCHETSRRSLLELGDRLGTSVVLNNLGNVQRELGEYRRAFDLFLSSYTLCESVDDTYGVGVALGNLGMVLLDAAQPVKARAYLRRALALHRRVRSTQGQLKWLGRLAEAYRQTGDLVRASAIAEEAAALARRNGWRSGQVDALVLLARIALDQGRPAQARALLDTARPLTPGLPHQVLCEFDRVLADHRLAG
ncbi:AfsR/SARP family transcriptional regulator [Planosporangium sp. 12N6]|uniref:AfsR/SARP family transcriptional regulator n=1 Tax=Planosporangium spinosum TaxID=3402278 RepID=UPI003CFA01A2